MKNKKEKIKLVCMECGCKFTKIYSVPSKRIIDPRCPRCGSVDIDLE